MAIKKLSEKNYIMTEDVFGNLLKTILQSNMLPKEKEAAILNLFQCSPTVLQDTTSNPQETTTRQRKPTRGILKFTKKELSTMPKKFQDSFIIDNKIVRYRFYDGLFQARYRRNGFCIEVAARTFEGMKQKFVEKMQITIEIQPVQSQSIIADVLFSTYGWEWLSIKKKTTKPSTYAEYERQFKVYLEPYFGHYKLSQISRSMVQKFLFKYVEEGKNRTAEKLKLHLTCIFDMASDDFNLPSPMKKIVLPYYETKKGSALTKEEERQLIDYCRKKGDDVASALLILLYFGLRQSELASIRNIDNKFLECESSKVRLGRNQIFRKIPFTPVSKRVMPFIDFEAAKNVNLDKLKSAFRRFMPNHHPHELRYTFITRCKEAGVNPEVVMLWDGHTQDADARTSKVDRGYTDYSEEYLLKEAEKVNYEV